MKRLIFLAILPLLLPACSQFNRGMDRLPIEGGHIKMYPDGRWEIMIDPRTSK